MPGQASAVVEAGMPYGPGMRWPLSCLVLVAACGAAPRATDWQEAVSTAAPQVWQRRDAFLPALDPERVAQLGDHVHYEVEQHTGGEPKTWTFDLELVGLPPKGHFERTPDEVSGRVRSDRGRCVTTKRGEQVLSCIYSGLGEVRIAMHDDARDARSRDVATEVLLHFHASDLEGWPSFGMLALLNLVLKVDFAHERLMDVVRPPSIGSVVRRLGRVDLTARFPNEGRQRLTVASPFGEVEAVWIPLVLDANGEPALDCRVLVTDKHWPLQLSAGVLCLEACHPDAPDRRVTVRLRDAGGADR